MEICGLPVESVYYSTVLDGYHYAWSFHDFWRVCLVMEKKRIHLKMLIK